LAYKRCFDKAKLERMECWWNKEVLPLGGEGDVEIRDLLSFLTRHG
jgi:hypothetical protein